MVLSMAVSTGFTAPMLGEKLVGAGVWPAFPLQHPFRR
jgi:hypothetical protein